MKPKGHKTTLQDRQQKAEADKQMNDYLEGFTGEDRIRRLCEWMDVGYSSKPKSEAENLEFWPGAYHPYLKRLWREQPPQWWEMQSALWRVMEKGGADFKVHGLDRWFKKTELVAELEAIAREPWDLQLRIVTVLEVLWKSKGRWQSIQALPRKLALKPGEREREECLSALEKIEKRWRQQQANKHKEVKANERQRERWMHLEAVYQAAAKDEKGHTAPIDPHPAWLLDKARRQVPKPWPKGTGYIWDLAKLKFEDRLTWPSMHDLVIGLAMRRKEIEAEIEAHLEPWHMPPSTAPERPGRQVRYSPECLRWLIIRWLAREHPELEADELEHPSSFLRHILENLPECEPR